MRTVTVEDFVNSKKEALGLEVLTHSADLKRAIEQSSVSSPALALTGFTDRFPRGRLFVFGQSEMDFLRSLGTEVLRDRLSIFFALGIPAVLVTKAQEVPDAMIQMADEQGVPLIRTPLKTGEVYRRIHSFLESRIAPATTLHGSLADVHGVGLLFVGRSGIGKSECVLDLIERGHRLVADDLVLVTRRGNDVLIGEGHELQKHHMEIRGLGIIDVSALFGIRAIRQQKRIEVVVNLEDWDDGSFYDRTGLEGASMEILGVDVPKVSVPLNPGKNVTVIAEVIAMNHLLKYSGVHSAALFNRRLQDAMRPMKAYLEEDYE